MEKSLSPVIDVKNGEIYKGVQTQPDSQVAEADTTLRPSVPTYQA